MEKDSLEGGGEHDLEHVRFALYVGWAGDAPEHTPP